MTKDTAKNKTILKKSSVDSERNQQNLISQLDLELKDAFRKLQTLDFERIEKDKCLNELEESIKERIEEVHKVNAILEETKEENERIITEFNSFKEKFYKLETDYDKSFQQFKEDNYKFIEDLQKQNAEENQKNQKLSSQCCDLQQKLQNQLQEFDQLKRTHLETVRNFETMKKDFEKQAGEFEIHRKQVNDEKKINDAIIKQEFDKLKEELIRKDDIIKQCITDKESLEKEKNLIIDELKNKIHRIERAFSQPTKVVQPVTNLNQQQPGYENFKENSNVILPQVQKPLDDLYSLNTLANDNENKETDNNPAQRNHKFKRPTLLTSSQQTNVSNNRKRRNQPNRQSKIINYNLSSSSSDGTDDDESKFTDNSILLHNWRPEGHNDECYITDTDTSEGFAKSKRLKR